MIFHIKLTSINIWWANLEDLFLNSLKSFNLDIAKTICKIYWYSYLEYFGIKSVGKLCSRSARFVEEPEGVEDLSSLLSLIRALNLSL